MSNNIAVAVTADVAGLQVAMAKARAEFRATTKDLNDMVASTKGQDLTVEQRTQMLGYGDAVAKARGQVRALSAAEKELAATHVRSRAMTESLVMVHETLSGNYRRMAGSSMILAQSTQKGMSLIAAAMNPVGIAAIAATAAVGYLVYKEYEAEKASKATAEAFALTGRAADHSAASVRAETDALATMPGASRAAATALIEFDATHAEVSARLSNAANQLLPQYGKAFGEKAPEEINKLKEALADLENGTLDEALKKFDQLNLTMLNLSPAEAAMIQDMIRAGDTIGAVTRILGDLAKQGGGHIDSLNQQIIETEAQIAKTQGTAQALKNVVGGSSYNSLMISIGSDASDADAKVVSLKAHLQDLRKWSAEAEHGRAVNAAINESDAMLDGLKDNKTRANEAVETLHKDMEQRRAAKPTGGEKARVDDYFAHQDKYDADERRRMDPEDFAKPKKAKKPTGMESPMAKMEEELRSSEFTTKSQSGDWSKDMQGFEVKFWEGKLETAKRGSKLYGDIMARVQQAKLGEGQRTSDQQRQITTGGIDADLSVQKAGLTNRRSDADAGFEQAMLAKDFGVAISAAETKRSALRAIAQEEAADEVAAVQAKAKAYANDPVHAAEAANQVRVINANLTTQLAEIDRQGVADHERAAERKAQADEQAGKKSSKAWQSANREIQGAEDQLVAGIIGRRQTMGQILLGIGGHLVQREIQNDLHYLTQHALFNRQAMASDEAKANGGFLVHLFGEAKKTAATAAGTEARVATTASGAVQTAAIQGVTNKKSITSDAASAAAGAYKALAGIPIVGPFLGAAAAATTFTAVEAFGTLASFDKGTNMLPHDMIAQVHAGERIIPAADNRALMAAVDGGRGDRGRAGGDMHLTYAPQLNADTPSFRDQLHGHKDELVGIFRGLMRSGSLKAA